MNWFAILLLFNMQQDIIDTHKIMQPFSTREDCELFGALKAGQQMAGFESDPASPVKVIRAVCVQLRGMR